MIFVPYLLLSFCFFVLLAFYIKARTKDALHYGIVYIGFHVLSYHVSLLLGFEYNFTVLNMQYIPEELFVFGLFLADLAAILFLLPIFITKYRIRASPLVEPYWRYKKVFLLILAGMLCVTLAMGINALKAVFSFSQDALASRITERGGGSEQVEVYAQFLML